LLLAPRALASRSLHSLHASESLHADAVQELDGGLVADEARRVGGEGSDLQDRKNKNKNKNKP
jgi:hypothetical protein